MVALRVCAIVALMTLTVFAGLTTAGTSPDSTEPVLASAQDRLPIRIYESTQMADYRHLLESEISTQSEAPGNMLSPRDFDALPEEFEIPVSIGVWTSGEPSEHILYPTTEQLEAGTVTWITINKGRDPTNAEVQELAKYGVIEQVFELSSKVVLSVSSKDAIRQVASLPLSQVVMIYGPGGGELTFNTGHAYDRSWMRTTQNVDDMKARRTSYDGSGDGRMPAAVGFHVIDSGYDATETKWSTAHANARINAHKMDWAASDPHNGNIASGTNWHGTAVADILDIVNYHGGAYWAHRVSTAVQMETALRHILGSHAEADVISSSAGVTVNDYVCRGWWDDVLRDLMNRNVYMSFALGNPRDDTTIPDFSYPATSTFAAGVSGAVWHTPMYEWSAASNGAETVPTGQIELQQQNCPVQSTFHADTDGAPSIFKPDVFSWYEVDVDVGDNIRGTSFSQPQVASGLGTIQSRFELGQLTTRLPFKAWNDEDNCWLGVYRLMWRHSQAPDGEDVHPTTTSQRGAIGDHDKWWTTQAGCGSVSYPMIDLGLGL